MIHMRPAYHRSTNSRCDVTVSTDEPEDVCLDIDTEDDVRIDVHFTSDEARALAAMLNHFADECCD